MKFFARLKALLFIVLISAALSALIPKHIDFPLTQQQYQAMAYWVAQRHDLDPALFQALITQESAWNPRAISAKGAIGLGQLMPATAKALGVNPYQPYENLEGSARYLKAQLLRFGDVKLALCAYNAGPSRVAALGRCPAYPETQAYVKRILRRWQP